MIDLTWRKSTFSNNGQCIEIADLDEEIAVRNSNNPDAGTLILPRQALAAWVAGIKSGEFDDLA